MKIEHLNIVAPHNSYVICEGKRATFYREQWEPGDIPIGTDFIYFAKDYQNGIGIPNAIKNSDMGMYNQYSTASTFRIVGEGGESYLEQVTRNTSSLLTTTLTNERLNAMKALNSPYTFFIRIFHTNYTGAILMWGPAVLSYGIRSNGAGIQLYGSSWGRFTEFSDGDVCKIRILGSTGVVSNLENGKSLSVNIGTGRGMTTTMRTYYTGNASEYNLDKLYGLAGIHRDTTAEEDEFFRQALHTQNLA